MEGRDKHLLASGTVALTGCGTSSIMKTPIDPPAARARGEVFGGNCP
jgi:hypothetical protein